MKPTSFLRQVLLYLALFASTWVLILPLLWLVSTSLKPGGTELALPPNYFDFEPRWENYTKLMTGGVGGGGLRGSFWIFFKNSFIITILATIGSVLSCSIVGFSFARIHFPGRDYLFTLLLSTMMLPVIIQIVPQFLMYKYFGWLETFLPLIIPSWFAQAQYGHGAFYIFLMRQFFKGIPMEFDEAARVDGANALQIYWFVIMPLATPALITVGVFAFLSNWSDFLYPLIFLSDKTMFTISLGIRQFMMTGGGNSSLIYTQLAGASVISIIPPLVVLLFFQRYFVKGTTLSGLAGR